MSDEVAEETADKYKTAESAIQPPPDINDRRDLKFLSEETLYLDILFVISVIGSFITILLLGVYTDWSATNLSMAILALIFLSTLGIILLLRTQKKYSIMN